MMNSLKKLSHGTPEAILAYLSQISAELSPQDQLDCINNMLAILSDLKASEGLIQARKNDIIAQLYAEVTEPEKSALTVVKRPEVEDDNINVGIDWVCEFTGRSKDTIYRWTHIRFIPHTKKGKRLSFHKQEIIDWWNKGKKKTADEVRSEVLSSLQ